MLLGADGRLVRSFRAFARVAAGVVVLVGALAFLGWVCDNEFLRSLLPDRVAMNPVTALAFVAAGLALTLLHPTRPRDTARRLGRGCALGVALVGLLHLGGYLLGWDGGLDQMLFAARLGGNRIAPNTALNFALLGMALLLLEVETRRGHRPAQLLALLAAGVTLLALVGYGYGVAPFTGIVSYVPMALPTALGFAALCAGVLAARPDRGVVSLLTSDGLGGFMARRLLPAAVAVPAVLGWLRLLGEEQGLYDAPFGVALYTVLTIVILTVAILTTTNALEQTEAQHRQAEESAQLFADVVKEVPIGLTLWQLEEVNGAVTLRLVAANPAASHLLGIDVGSLRGLTILDAFPSVTETDLRTYIDVARTGVVRDVGELRYGDHRVAANYWSVKAFPLPGPGVGLAFENVTRRRQAEDELRQLQGELEQRVRARTAELAEANHELAEKNRENEMFVYSVSHDLRSPLVNLQGFSQELGMVANDLRALLAGDDIPPAVRQRAAALLDGDMAESIRFIQSGVLRLSGIIDALLRLSRAGRVEYQWQAVDVHALATRVVASLRGTITERGATVTLRELPPAWGDPTALEQVFANLIANALNYLDPQRPGTIEVGWEAAPERGPGPAYYVRDNGLGIAEAYQQKIFQIFQRAHPEAAKGEGIGLAIVRRVIERHRGKVWVESQPGRGSTFWVALPGPPESAAAPGAAVAAAVAAP